jgi:hypothetical protein
LSITTTTHTTRPLHTRIKTIMITISSPFVVKTPKREKIQRRCRQHVDY